MKPRQGGFTLIEMMVTLSLLAVLTSAVVPMAMKNAQRQKEEELRLALRQIRQAIDGYYEAAQEGRIDKVPADSGYPAELLMLVKGVVDKKSPNEKKIYFLRDIPRDPFCDCEGKTNVQTWRVRSYENPPGDYSPGKDVYDIASSNALVGLNGVAYAQW
jgi:general secretion pathway protein G